MERFIIVSHFKKKQYWLHGFASPLQQMKALSYKGKFASSGELGDLTAMPPLPPTRHCKC